MWGTVHSVQCTAYSTVMHNVECRGQCSVWVYSIQCAVYSIQCAVYSAVMRNVECKVQYCSKCSSLGGASVGHLSNCTARHGTALHCTVLH